MQVFTTFFTAATSCDASDSTLGAYGETQDESDSNEALEFARRTRRNLGFIDKAKAEGADVHVVTQLTLSLFGLVVFRNEKMLLNETTTKTLAAWQARDGLAGPLI